MEKSKSIKKQGIVTECLPNANFKVKLDNGQIILAHLAGKLRLFHIRILVGDRVVVELSPFDTTKGRIVFRKKY